MIKIVQYLISRPRLLKLILILLFLFAVSSIPRIQRLGHPRVDFDRMRVTTVYPGASPEDVELNVTVKLEQALKQASGIEKFFSRSMENVSIIDIFIDPDSEDKISNKQDIRRAIESVNDLPIEVEKKPEIMEIKVDNFEIYITVLSMENASKASLLKYAKELKRQLLEIPELSTVKTIGMPEQEIKVLLNTEKMARNFVSFDEVIQAIKTNKIRASGGSIESFTTKTNIVTFSEFESIEEIENIIIRANFEGNRIYLKDIAKVEKGFKEEDNIVRFNSKKGIGLSIIKKALRM